MTARAFASRTLPGMRGRKSSQTAIIVPRNCGIRVGRAMNKMCLEQPDLPVVICPHSPLVVRLRLRTLALRRVLAEARRLHLGQRLKWLETQAF
jgi:hypothetical protein